MDLEGGTLVAHLDAQELLVSFYAADVPDVVSVTTGAQAGDALVTASVHDGAPSRRVGSGRTSSR